MLDIQNVSASELSCRYIGILVLYVYGLPLGTLSATVKNYFNLNKLSH